MPLEAAFWWMSLIIVFSYAAQSLSGFGAVVIGVTLGSLLFPIRTLPPLLIPLSLLLSGYIALRFLDKVRWEIILYAVLPFVCLGMLAGIIVVELYPNFNLKLPLAVLIISLSLLELIKLIMDKRTFLNRYLEKVSINIWMFISGIIHGLYGSGGPFLVYGMKQTKLDKKTFRATLCAIWFILNFILTIFYIVHGDLNAEVGKMMLKYLPAVFIGSILGDIIHNYVPEKTFSIIIFIVLLASGFSLLFREVTF